MPHDQFRVALVLSPERLVSVSVLAGDMAQGQDWLLERRQLIQEFVDKLNAKSPRRRRPVRTPHH
jgi:hypothetical protein